MFKRKLIGKVATFLVILFVAFVYNKVVFESKTYGKLPDDTKNLCDIGVIIIIYLIGVWGIKNLKTNWVSKLFIYTYLSGIVFLVIALVIDAFFYHYSHNGHNRFLSIKFLLWNPFTYFMLLWLDSYFGV